MTITDARAPTLLVHIGPHKTGSTSFQAFLVTHANILSRENFENPYRRGTKEAAKLAWALANSSAVALNGEEIKNYWVQCLTSAYARKKNLILSSEVFDSFSIENWLGFANLAEGFDIHIVMVYRDTASWLSSQYQEMLWQSKGEEKMSFAEYIVHARNTYVSVPDIASNVKGLFGTDHVHIVDYNGMLAAGDSLEVAVFCNMFPAWFRITCSSVRRSSRSIAHSNPHRSVLLEQALHLAVKYNHTSISNYHTLMLQLGAHPDKLPAFPRLCLQEEQVRQIWKFTKDIDRRLRSEWGSTVLYNNLTATVQLLAHDFHFPSVSSDTPFKDVILSDKWCDLDVAAFEKSTAMLQWMKGLKVTAPGTLVVPNRTFVRTAGSIS